MARMVVAHIYPRTRMSRKRAQADVKSCGTPCWGVEREDRWSSACGHGMVRVGCLEDLPHLVQACQTVIGHTNPEWDHCWQVDSLALPDSPCLWLAELSHERVFSLGWLRCV